MSIQTDPLTPLEATSRQPLYLSELSAQQRKDQVANPPSVHWCGRCVTRGVQTAVDSVCFVFYSVMNSVAAAVDETGILRDIIRKMDRHILLMIEQIGQIPPDYLRSFSTAIRSLTRTLEFMYSIQDILYYLSSGYKRETSLNAYGRMWLTASNIGYGFLWLQELGINKLSNVFTGISNCHVFNFVPAVVKNIPVLRSMPRLQQAAASIGNLSIFSFTTRITLKSIAQSAFSLAFLFYTTQSLQNLINAVKAGEANKVMGAALEGLYFISELVLESLSLFGYSSVMGLGILAIASIAFSIVNFSYNFIDPEK